ncbi:hypothetical protein ACIBBD_29065 [Streptomyces sp. NPDC051315]|uniref:hypothetical protein n=1 Tax=Streptomyces sp. NPDC051315 TaxID=3365650 RepID=UPI0037BC45B8
MVFHNIFGSAITGTGLFAVTTDSSKQQWGADVDFEDSVDGTYDDKSTSLFSNAIHGASSRAKVVQEQSPEARVILGFLGSFIQTTKDSAETQSTYASEAGSVFTSASEGMQDARSNIPKDDGLQKNSDLKEKPQRGDYAKAPKTPEAPQAAEAPAAPKATAETPQTLGETKKATTATGEPSGSQ